MMSWIGPRRCRQCLWRPIADLPLDSLFNRHIKLLVWDGEDSGSIGRFSLLRGGLVCDDLRARGASALDSSTKEQFFFCFVHTIHRMPKAWEALRRQGWPWSSYNLHYKEL